MGVGGFPGVRHGRMATAAAANPRARLSEHDLDLVLAAVVAQGDERLGRERLPVKAEPGHPTADPLRVLDGDPVVGAAMMVGDLEPFPPSGDARIDAESGPSLPESENPLEARTVEPARGPG